MRAKKAGIWIGGVLLLSGLLTGCGGQKTEAIPDAEKVFDRSGHYEMDVSMEVSVTGGGTIGADMHLEGDGQVSHIADMDMSIVGDGEEIGFQNEVWYDGGTLWSRAQSEDEDTGWVSQEYDGTVTDDISGLFEKVFPDEIETVQTDGLYQASWEVSFSDVAPALEIVATGISDIAEYADMGVLTATASFEENLCLSSFQIESDGSGADGFIRIVFTNVTCEPSVGLSVPEQVIAEAVSVTEDGTVHAPVDGKWGEPRSDGYVAEVNWMDEDSDEQIDAIVERITTEDIGFNILDVSHQNEMAIMYNSGSGGEWNATMNIFRYESHEEAAAAMLTEYESTNPMYGPAFVQTGEKDAPTWVVFVLDKSESLGTYVLILGVQDNLFLECGGFDWVSDTKEEAMENLLLMVDVTGLDWGRSD